MALDFVEEPYSRAAGAAPLAGGAYDQEVRQRAANLAKRRAAGLVAPVAPTTTATAPAVTRGFGALSRFLPGVGAAIGIGGEAVGVADTVTDPNATKIDVATRVAEGAGRLGAAGVGAAGGAALGAMTGPLAPVAAPVGALLGGAAGYMLPNLFYSNRGATPPADPFAPTPVPGLKAAPVPLMPPAPAPTPVAQAAPAIPPVAPMTVADIQGTGVPTFGTGAMVNNRTGAVTNFDSRAAIAAAPTAPAATSGGWVGAFARGHGAALEMKQVANDNTRKANAAKIGMEYNLKLPGALKDAAEAQNVAARTAAADAHLKANPGDFAGAGAIAAGRTPAGDVYSGYPGIDGKTIDVLSKRTGAVQKVTPTVAPTTLTFAQAKAQAMKNPQYKFVDDATLRKDLAASGKYKITD